MEEIWKSVVGFGRYEISNWGRIRSLRYRKTNNVKVLKPTIASKFDRGRARKGYYQVALIMDDKIPGTKVMKKIHHLVTEAFIGPRLKDYEVNHKDGNTLNNNVENLEYVTHQENCLHANKNGLRKYTAGDKHHNHKLTQEQVNEIRERKKIGGTRYGIIELANKFNVSTSLISHIANNKQWKQ